MSPSAGKHSLFAMAFAATFYGVASASMNFLNKFLLTSWSFDHPAVLVLSQLCMLGACLRFLKWAGRIELHGYTQAGARSCCALSVFYLSNTLFALFALGGMNVPMYNAMRRCVPLASMLLGFAVFSKRQTFLVICSIIVITMGTVIAAIGDLQFDLRSYLFGLSSVILMAMYLITLQNAGNEEHLSTLDLLYINTLNCIPISFLICAVSAGNVLSYEHWTNARFIVSFLTVSFSGCVLNYSLFLCTTVNSALTTTCVGVIKSAFTTILGMFVFGGVIATPFFVTGQVINFGGGVMYAYAKYVEKSTKIHQHSKEEIA